MTESAPTAAAISELERNGYAILADVLSGVEVKCLVAVIEAHVASVGAEGQAGLRTLAMQLPEVRAMRAHPKLIALASEILGSPAFVVRTLLFDKTPGANWKVPWHQDLTIAVRERRNLDGFGPWSMKDGIPHVQPPTKFLARMITLRIHLDDCFAENGALRVLPGTHRSGRLSPAEINHARGQSSEAICEVSQGGLLIMRPLLLHASSPAISPHHRRVLHLEFAAEHLPEGLAWAEDNTCN